MNLRAKKKPSSKGKKPAKAKSIDECLENCPPELKDLAQQLRRFIQQHVPESRESVNAWGIPTFSLAGSFAFLIIAKAHLSLGFAQGTSLEDPDRLLEGSGKNLRHVKIRVPEDLSRPGMAALVRDAARLEQEIPPEMRRSRM